VRPFPFKPPPAHGPVKDGASGSGAEPQEHTEVSLAIEYQFSNPVYSAMSGAVADKVAGVMIEAFKARVKQVLDGRAGVSEKETGSLLFKSGQGP